MPVLAKVLDGQLRSGGAELDLVRTMNAAIAETAPADEMTARRQALLSAAGALRGRLTARSITSLLSGRWHRAWRLHEAMWDVTEFALDLAGAAPDPDADILRVQLLQLSLINRAADAGEAGLALRAMVRVAFAGTAPVH